MSSKSVIVIGGGLAGLAAGVALAEAGWRVRLFEQRPFLGGRATSYVLPDGEHVDNCQHVTLGCCTNLEDFYRRVGAPDKIKFFERLLFFVPQGLRRYIRPAVPLSKLYDGCKAEIERRGGEVVLRSPVRGLKIENGELAGVRFDEGREETADAYVFAVPHTALTELLPESVKQSDPGLKNLDKIKVSPITGVHLWFDRPVMAEPFVTLLDTTTQWIFNKTALYGDSNGAGESAPDGQYLQLVISASYDLLPKPRQEIVDLCLKEVRQALPAARNAQLLKSTVIKEPAATFLPEPGVDRWRPKQQTFVRGLFLAGDWTAPGWPPTMDAAGRSGYLAP